MTDYEHNKGLAVSCAEKARAASDPRIRRFHEAARDTFLARAVAALKKEWQEEEEEEK